MDFVCPKCMLPLELTDTGVARCAGGHSYDRSREGYYNLLLSPSGKIHGDSKDMILSRRRFLESGHYLPLANEVVRMLLKYAGGEPRILDMGCGEGYYTEIFDKLLREHSVMPRISAFDISKDAVRLASRRNKNISFAVASSYKIPALDASFDAAVNIFSPLAIDETHRVLGKNGIFVMAVPDKEHLYGLKAAVYDEPYYNQPAESSLPGFVLLEETKLRYPMELDGALARDLFMMTPYAYRTSEREMQRLNEIEKITAYAEFIVLTYAKK